MYNEKVLWIIEGFVVGIFVLLVSILSFVQRMTSHLAAIRHELEKANRHRGVIGG